MSELPIEQPAVQRRRWLDALKMVVISLVLGPPIAEFVAAFALMVPHTMMTPLEPLDSWRGFAILPVAFVYSLFLGLIVAVPGALFSYLLGWSSAIMSAVLFVLADHVVPPRWPRPWLGALCGGLATAGWFAYQFADMAGLEAVSNVAIVTLGGCVSGYACASIFKRASLTRWR